MRMGMSLSRPHRRRIIPSHVFLGEVVEAGVNSQTPTLLIRDTGWNCLG
jgi:hypothetical protein